MCMIVTPFQTYCVLMRTINNQLCNVKAIWQFPDRRPRIQLANSKRSSAFLNFDFSQVWVRPHDLWERDLLRQPIDDAEDLQPHDQQAQRRDLSSKSTITIWQYESELIHAVATIIAWNIKNKINFYYLRVVRKIGFVCFKWLIQLNQRLFEACIVWFAKKQTWM